MCRFFGRLRRHTKADGTDGATDTNAKDTYKIGVLQYADHPSLDNCREGLSRDLIQRVQV